MGLLLSRIHISRTSGGVNLRLAGKGSNIRLLSVASGGCDFRGICQMGQLMELGRLSRPITAHWSGAGLPTPTVWSFQRDCGESAPSKLKFLPRRKNAGRKQGKQACFFSQMKLSGPFVSSVGGENVQGRYLREKPPPQKPVMRTRCSQVTGYKEVVLSLPEGAGASLHRYLL